MISLLLNNPIRQFAKRLENRTTFTAKALTDEIPPNHLPSE